MLTGQNDLDTSFEIWVPIAECDNYSVSSQGRVRRDKGGKGATAGRILKQSLNKDGYPFVHLYKNDKVLSRLVSRLVCEAFNGKPPHVKDEAAHLDGVKVNNRMGNLIWASREENESHKIHHGTLMAGEKHPNSKLSDEDVRKIRQDTRTQKKIALDYGVAQSLISFVKNKKIWAHV